ncbi:MAG: hypothetical protein AB8B84_11620 [Granulosicoccus sp.]
MRQPDVLASSDSKVPSPTVHQKRKMGSVLWQPFLQYKPLAIMLGLTVFIAMALGVFLYVAFSDMIGIIDHDGNSHNYYGEMIGKQLINIFRYSAALFMLYVILLASICVTYTHRVAGLLQPFNKHIDALRSGDYAHRVTLRHQDLPIFVEHAEKLNALASELESKEPIKS